MLQNSAPLFLNLEITSPQPTQICFSTCIWPQAERLKAHARRPHESKAHLAVQLAALGTHLRGAPAGLWIERFTAQRLLGIGKFALGPGERRVKHPLLKWMGATLDGMVEQSGAVFEAKFMLPWYFSEVTSSACKEHQRFLFLLDNRRPIPPVSSSSIKTTPACSKAVWMRANVDA